MLPDLPISNAIPRLRSHLDTSQSVVLVAPPGAGKTTLVPLALLGAPWRADHRIVMLEPRRLATRAAAARMAQLLGEQPGQTVGYRTRLEARVSAGTRIEVVTEGTLVRRLQSDPGLENVAGVILDEVHERSLEGDLALALCLDLQRGLRPELRLIAMSATPEGARLAGLMDAEIIESPGRIFPVRIEHAGRDIPHLRELPASMASAIRRALAEHEGDILAFLPGMAEIRRTQEALAGCGAAVLPLHGDLAPAEQDLALRPGEGRRVVLATSIAETSLTVPGVRIIIDGGWRRSPRLDPATGLTRLTTVRISRAAAEQRAGRAGREGPGLAIRLWTEALHRGLVPYDRPEILEAELSGFLLECAAWGTNPAALLFLDQPPAGALAAARNLLGELGALDSAGRVTEAGRAMVRLGAHPRLAAMMLEAATPEEGALACELAALLEERDPLRAPDAPADIGLRLLALAEPPRDADRAVVSRIRHAAGQYQRRLQIPADCRPQGDLGRLLAAGFPDRIAQRRGEPGSFRLAGGGGARLPRTDNLASANLLAVAALELKTGARIRLAAPLKALPASLQPRVIETVETSFDPAAGTVLARRRRRFGSLVLQDQTAPADPEQAAAILARVLAQEGLTRLPWTSQARQLQQRVARMREIEPDWPDLSDAALAASAQEWLAPQLAGISRLAEAERLDLYAILNGMLTWDQVRRLDRELPSQLDLPKGRAVVDYTQPVPVAAARAQAFFGLTTTPQLAGGRIPLQLALLSPAGRPIAVTGDLAGFWKGAWREVRKEMRGRYPKHLWPEDGTTC
ncbi:MAG: ATP-dependent helicase HrpB [Acetobacteraceae bacterium]|nr:ATP-dependent helicase HrpB [Acetobacteraceae bacterium]